MNKIDKIICVGKNYLEHSLELNEPVPEKPVLFLKPASVLKQATDWEETIHAAFPALFNENVQPECEIVLKVDVTATAIEAVAIGLDVTLRQYQSQLKKMGHPWTTAKVFVDSAIISPWINGIEFEHLMNEEFTMAIDGVIRQRAYGNQMVMKPVDLLGYISQFFPVCAGDIIFTGTPAGVSAITLGSKVDLNWSRYHLSVDWGNYARYDAMTVHGV